MTNFDEVRLRAAMPSNHEAACVLRCARTAPYWVAATIEDIARTYEAKADDLFQALCDVRTQLEPGGWMLCCQGSRQNVWPSAMGRQMSGGRKAYVLALGHRPGPDQLVDIFRPAPCDQVVKVDVQAAYYQQWLTSLE